MRSQTEYPAASAKQVQLAGVLLICVVATITIVRFCVTENKRINGISDSPPPVYWAKLVDKQAATPGKVIRITSKGKLAAQYVCDPGDAAVATVELGSNGPAAANLLETTISSSVTLTDPTGRPYSFDVHNQGKYIFITLRNGFANTPSLINLKGAFYVGRDAIGKPDANIRAALERISPSTRVLKKPTLDESRAAEKVAIAEYVESKKGFYVKVTEKAQPERYRVPTILASSFCSPDPAPDTTYADSVDTLKVKIGRYKRTYSTVELTYHNAKVVTIRGCRLLWFPTTQQVGTIDGRPAMIYKYRDDAFERSHLKAPHGIVSVTLGKRKPSPDRVVPGALRLDSVSPAPADMGLSWLSVYADRYFLSDLLFAHPGDKLSNVTTIPRLSLRFTLRTDLEDSYQTLVLPVHHVKDDYALFHPKPKYRIGNLTYGASDDDLRFMPRNVGRQGQG